MILVALLALSVHAAGVQKVAEIPALPSPVIAYKPGELLFTRDLDRNTALQAMADAGGSEYFNGKGLSLWQASPYHAGNGLKLELTFAAFDAKEPATALERRVAKLAGELTSWISDKTGVDADNISLHAKPLTECCGSRCPDCLHSKKGPSRYWTRQEHRK